MDALDCHPDLMKEVYEAHHRFGNLLHDDKFQIKFRLVPGDIFLLIIEEFYMVEPNMIRILAIVISKDIIWIAMK